MEHQGNKIKEDWIIRERQKVKEMLERKDLKDIERFVITKYAETLK